MPWHLEVELVSRHLWQFVGPYTDWLLAVAAAEPTQHPFLVAIAVVPKRLPYQAAVRFAAVRPKLGSGPPKAAAEARQVVFAARVASRSG